jgi:hypothetical protein
MYTYICIHVNMYVHSGHISPKTLLIFLKSNVMVNFVYTFFDDWSIYKIITFVPLAASLLRSCLFEVTKIKADMGSTDSRKRERERERERERKREREREKLWKATHIQMTNVHMRLVQDKFCDDSFETGSNGRPRLWLAYFDFWCLAT